ncbi:uncharacterized protein [Eurosta solidaginis]|uniref:uncharacterized protein n=1 Tax=Eurosta solidaginis TaxID=178769 RepID=UPI00353158DD
MNAVIALCHFCEAHGPSAIFCTQTQFVGSEEQFKCQNLTVAIERDRALFDDAFLNLTCHMAYSADECIHHIDREKAHITTLDAGDVFTAGRYNSLVPIMQEQFIGNLTNCHAVAVVKKDSLQDVYSLRELRNKRACFPWVGSMAGWIIPIYTLQHEGGMKVVDCNNQKLVKWLSYEIQQLRNMLPPKSSDRPQQQRLTYNLTWPMLQKYEETMNDPEREVFYSLRHVKEVPRNKFNTAVYCALTGIKIIVRSSSDSTLNFMLCLKKLLPEPIRNRLCIDAQHKHSINSNYRIISVSNEMAVPIASTSVYRVDFLGASADGNKVRVKWLGELPMKCPDLMVKLLKAVDEPRFTPLVLKKHTTVLIKEYKTKII